MGIFDRWFTRGELKESRVAATMVVNPSQPVWTPRDYASFAKECYTQNVVGYQAINKISEAVSSVSWELHTPRGELITESPLLDLINNPNPNQSGVQFLTEYVGYLMISGNSYVERVSVGAEPKELYNLRPDRMTVKMDASGAVQQYCYKVNQRTTLFEPEEIRHLKLFNPVHDVYGLSPVEASAYGVDQHNEAMKWVQSLLQNSARPSGALSTDTDLSDENYNRLKTQLEDQYQGSGNAGRPMIFENGLTWQSMGLSPSDVGIIDTKNSAARDICLAFGVPPQLLGIPGDNTYSNYAEARLAFWEDTVLPLLGMIAADWTAWLGGGLEFKPNLDEIPAIVDKRETLWQMVEATQSLTVNEKREAMGFEPIEGGDVLLVNASQIPLADASLNLDDISPNPTDMEAEDEELVMKALARIAGYEQK